MNRCSRCKKKRKVLHKRGGASFCNKDLKIYQKGTGKD